MSHLPDVEQEVRWATPEMIEAARRVAPPDLHDMLGLTDTQEGGDDDGRTV